MSLELTANIYIYIYIDIAKFFYDFFAKEIIFFV